MKDGRQSADADSSESGISRNNRPDQHQLNRERLQQSRKRLQQSRQRLKQKSRKIADELASQEIEARKKQRHIEQIEQIMEAYPEIHPRSTQGAYLSHFGLKELPFNQNPDTRYYFESLSQQLAFSTIQIALEEESRFTIIIGDAGSGKTLLGNRLVEQLGSSYRIAYLHAPPSTPQQLYRSILCELGQGVPQGTTDEQLLKNITGTLLSLTPNQQLLVMVDEAQQLADEAMEALHLLSTMEADNSSGLQVILLGQPVLEQRLQLYHLRHISQQTLFSDQLYPLTESELEGYLSHRLFLAGFRGDFPFSRVVMQQIYHASGGIPKLVNILAHKALFLAYGKRAYRVSRRNIKAAIRDTDTTQVSPVYRVRKQKWFSCLLLLMTVLLLFWMEKEMNLVAVLINYLQQGLTGSLHSGPP